MQSPLDIPNVSCLQWFDVARKHETRVFQTVGYVAERPAPEISRYLVVHFYIYPERLQFLVKKFLAHVVTDFLKIEIAYFYFLILSVLPVNLSRKLFKLVRHKRL